MREKIYLFLALCLLAGACGSGYPEPDTVSTSQTGDNDLYYVRIPAEAGVTVPCIVVDGYQSTAISCDWSGR